MKSLVKNVALVLALVVVAFNFASCEEEIKDSGNSDETNVNAAVEACSRLATLFESIEYKDGYDNLYKQILDNYVTETVIPTYKSLAESAIEMRNANRVLKTSLTDGTVKTAAEAWMKARIAWEISEAFLFGPVGENAFDIDAHVDSWPLELEAIKASIAEGSTITGKEAWLLDAEVIGFHVTEYLLYRDGKSRPASDITSAEVNYLIAAGDALAWDCALAYVAWAGEANVSSDIQSVFNENSDIVDHFNENSNYHGYGNKLKNATDYSSFGDAVTEISDGAIDIAGEVGETKIASPYATRKVEEVESWYSWHSLEDYQNNIKSIKNAYLGGLDNNTRKNPSLSTYVAQVNPQLDTAIRKQIDECIAKIAAIGAGGKSFYEVVRDHK